MNTPKKLLIVDDEPNVRLVFKTALESSGFEVMAAEDGPSALLWLASDPFDLVLLDLRMPGMDGMDVLAALRDRGDDVPVIIVTAHGTVPDAVKAMKLGAIDFLSKPIGPIALRSAVQDVLDRRGPSKAKPVPPMPIGPVTVESKFAEELSRAKWSLTRRRFDDADIFLREALALNPASAEAHNLKGVLHELRGEHDASYREYRAALKADPRHAPARNNMKRYYERFTFGHSDIPLDQGVNS